MTWDDFIYGLVTLIVILFIAWLIFVPAPGHDPLLVFRHSGLVA
jgi:hypothetical protein